MLIGRLHGWGIWRLLEVETGQSGVVLEAVRGERSMARVRRRALVSRSGCRSSVWRRHSRERHAPVWRLRIVRHGCDLVRGSERMSKASRM
jgi:hypothetical protein